MTHDSVHRSQISRRRVLAGMAGATGLGALGPLAGSALAQAAGPWAQQPKGKVDKLNFVVWTYGDIYTRISRQFEADWGVKLNDPAQSPIAGKVKVHGSPGEGKTIGVTNVYFLSTANRDKEWAWKVLQYLGGKTKDGQYTQAINLAKDAMLGSGYQSVMQSDAVKKGWVPWGDVPAILAMWDKAIYIGEVCNSAYQPWHFPWSDQLNIEVQKCLTGQITADQCCDNLIKGIAEAKKKV